MNKISFNEFCILLEELKNDAVFGREGDKVNVMRGNSVVSASIELAEGVRIEYSYSADSEEMIILKDRINAEWLTGVTNSGKEIKPGLTMNGLHRKITDNGWCYERTVDDLYTDYSRMVELHNAIEAGTAAEHLDDYVYTVDSPF